MMAEYRSPDLSFRIVGTPESYLDCMLIRTKTAQLSIPIDPSAVMDSYRRCSGQVTWTPGYLEDHPFRDLRGAVRILERSDDAGDSAKLSELSR